ncbi:MAG TPA: MoaD/ThiS family protein [Spirochaetota bacterium]|nr:MoaD/ThiS family protein [Spirochaetota bacterium]HOD14302.1 MoaD/ThiS family protein [Spirochaetota bacterium]HPG51267.1 MoaD/ThiS family protein [Spirochaetota bacterium]HPN13656.1 MoaD/ThiS family protein [Spirochaetota bacterium]HQL83149.1 MoaD/ThiS family protein [Spirochaetota bacterium]
MKIKVKAFASVREAFGFDEKELTVSDGITVKDVIRQITRSYQPAIDREMTLLFSINEEYCRDDAPLSDGDRLAIFPPVSGG